MDREEDFVPPKGAYWWSVRAEEAIRSVSINDAECPRDRIEYGIACALQSIAGSLINLSMRYD